MVGMKGRLGAKSLGILVLLIGCTSKRDLGSLPDGGGGNMGTAGAAGQGGAGPGGAGGAAAGSGGAAGAAAGSGGAAGAAAGSGGAAGGTTGAAGSGGGGSAPMAARVVGTINTVGSTSPPANGARLVKQSIGVVGARMCGGSVCLDQGGISP
jgi:hypothetical protein